MSLLKSNVKAFFITFIIATPIFFFVFQYLGIFSDPIPGCTDKTSFNYNEEATSDDGSCIDIIRGCVDSTAFNYNEEANTDDSSCIFEIDAAWNFLKSNLKDPYSAEFIEGGSWELPSFQEKYPCIKVKYLDVRAKNSFGAYNLERYFVAFNDKDILPEPIARSNKSDGDIGMHLEMLCVIAKTDCKQAN